MQGVQAVHKIETHTWAHAHLLRQYLPGHFRPIGAIKGKQSFTLWPTIGSDSSYKCFRIETQSLYVCNGRNVIKYPETF